MKKTSNTRYTVTVGVKYPSGNVKFYTRKATGKREALNAVDVYMNSLGKECHTIIPDKTVFIGSSRADGALNGTIYGAFAERCTLVF